MKKAKKQRPPKRRKSLAGVRKKPAPPRDYAAELAGAGWGPLPSLAPMPSPVELLLTIEEMGVEGAAAKWECEPAEVEAFRADFYRVLARKAGLRAADMPAAMKEAAAGGVWALLAQTHGLRPA